MNYRDYDKDKGKKQFFIRYYIEEKNICAESLKTFLVEFCTSSLTQNTQKHFKYAEQLTKLAHREQIVLYIELDDLNDYDNELTDAIINNTRRYSNMLYETIFEMLPTFKQHDVPAKDALDVYVEHRLMMEGRTRQQNEQRDARNKFPPELMRRL